MTARWSGDYWDDVLDIEEFRKLVDEAGRSRANYVRRVREFVVQLRMCPLIVSMYGGMSEAFGVDSPWKKDLLPPLELKLELPKTIPSRYWLVQGLASKNLFYQVVKVDACA